jgi:hypothetical protein
MRHNEDEKTAKLQIILETVLEKLIGIEREIKEAGRYNIPAENVLDFLKEIRRRLQEILA